MTRTSPRPRARGTRIAYRTPDDSDLPALVALAHDASAELDEPAIATAEDFRLEWGSPHFERDRHARVAELNGRVVAMADVWPREGQVYGEAYVAQRARGRGIGSALLAWMIEAARAEPGVSEFHTGVPATRAEGIELVERTPGFRHVRSFYSMRHSSPGRVARPRWPEGIGLASLRHEALIAATVAAHDASFVDHWNFSPARAEDYRHWTTHPEDDPQLWLIALAGDEVAGFCLCFLEGPPGMRRGVVGQLGVVRGSRGIGLGRALLREGVRRLAARGAGTVELGVDAENPTGALELYRRAGFKIAREQRRYVLAM